MEPDVWAVVVVLEITGRWDMGWTLNKLLEEVEGEAIVQVSVLIRCRQFHFAGGPKHVEEAKQPDVLGLELWLVLD